MEYEKLDKLRIAYEQLEQESQSSPSDDLGQKVLAAKQAYDKQQSYIDEQKILPPNMTKPSTIERLAASSKSSSLIAGASASQARTLVALYHLDVLGKGSSFNFDEERKLGNCVMAGLLHGGHHSFLEVVEPHNRLLDVVAIDAIERDDADTVSRCLAEQIPVIDISPKDYATAFHQEYRASILAMAEGEEAIDLPKLDTTNLATDEIAITSEEQLTAGLSQILPREAIAAEVTANFRAVLQRGREAELAADSEATVTANPLPHGITGYS